MSAGKCKGCGHMTNSATSNWWHTDDFATSTKCYVRWVDNKGERGCGYNEATNFQKDFADKTIKQEEEWRNEKDNNTEK